MTEKDALRIVQSYHDHVYQLNNVYIFGWESDYFGMTKSTRYCYEIEVKLSVSDFRNDFKFKEAKHHSLKNPDKELISYPKNGEYSREGEYSRLVYRKNLTPNRFYYAVPSELIDKIKPLIPKYAGLISLQNSCCYQIKAAPFLHKSKIFDLICPILLNKYYYKFMNLKFDIYQLEQSLKMKDYYEDPENFNENISQLDFEFNNK